MKRSFRITRLALVACGLALGASGCTYYQVAPGVYTTAPTSTFERSWAAAAGAMEDEGVQILNADRATGTISGMRGGISMRALVRSQADGSTQIEFKTSGDTASDPTLIDRITRSYNRRMGR